MIATLRAKLAEAGRVTVAFKTVRSPRGARYRTTGARALKAAMKLVRLGEAIVESDETLAISTYGEVGNVRLVRLRAVRRSEAKPQSGTLTGGCSIRRLDLDRSIPRGYTD